MPQPWEAGMPLFLLYKESGVGWIKVPVLTAKTEFELSAS